MVKKSKNIAGNSKKNLFFYVKRPRCFDMLAPMFSRLVAVIAK